MLGTIFFYFCILLLTSILILSINEFVKSEENLKTIKEILDLYFNLIESNTTNEEKKGNE